MSAATDSYFERPRWYLLAADGSVSPTSDLAQAEAMLASPRRIVGRTILSDGRWLSTVFLGLDHRHLGDGPPILFESMLFGPNDRADLLARYVTHAEAVEGHRHHSALLQSTTLEEL